MEQNDSDISFWDTKKKPSPLCWSIEDQVNSIIQSGNYCISDSGIAIDMTGAQKVCRGHCQNAHTSAWNIVCRKREKCINFPKADNNAKKRSDALHQEIIEHLY